MEPNDWGYGDGPFVSIIVDGAAVQVDSRIGSAVEMFLAEASTWDAPIDAVSGRENASGNEWVLAGAGFLLSPEKHQRGSAETRLPVRKVRQLCSDLGFVWGRDLPEVDTALFRVKHPANVMAAISAKARPQVVDRPPLRRPLSRGDWGPAIEWASGRLHERGYLVEKPSRRFTLGMSRAIRRLQNDQGMRVNGVLTPAVYDNLMEA